MSVSDDHDMFRSAAPPQPRPSAATLRKVPAHFRRLRTAIFPDYLRRAHLQASFALRLRAFGSSLCRDVVVQLKRVWDVQHAWRSAT